MYDLDQIINSDDPDDIEALQRLQDLVNRLVTPVGDWQSIACLDPSVSFVTGPSGRSAPSQGTGTSL